MHLYVLMALAFHHSQNAQYLCQIESPLVLVDFPNKLEEDRDSLTIKNAVVIRPNKPIPIQMLDRDPIAFLDEKKNYINGKKLPKRKK